MYEAIKPMLAMNVCEMARRGELVLVNSWTQVITSAPVTRVVFRRIAARGARSYGVRILTSNPACLRTRHDTIFPEHCGEL